VSRNDGLDALYEVPPREFVAARNKLATKLKQAGDDAGARRVREMARPKATVWAINHVARRSPRLVRAVVEAFEALKNAQLRNPSATPSGVDTLKRALDAVTRAALTALSDAGMKPSLETQRGIDGTLRGAAASARETLLAGALSDELVAPGFDVFGGAVPTGKPRLRVVKRSEDAAEASGGGRAHDRAAERRAARDAMLERRAAQLEEEARATDREAEAAAAAAHEARQRLRELEARVRTTASRASKSRSRAHKARARVGPPRSGGKRSQG
jgi:hypothetical protein